MDVFEEALISESGINLLEAVSEEFEFGGIV